MKLTRWPDWISWEQGVKALGQPECQAEYLALRGILHVRHGEDGQLEMSRDSIESWLGFEPELLSLAGREVPE